MKYRYRGLTVVILEEKENIVILQDVKNNSTIIADKELFKQFFTPVTEKKKNNVTSSGMQEIRKTNKPPAFTPKTKTIKKGKKEIEIITLF